MIRALVWKEVREQGVIATALAVLGVGLLVAVGVLAAANGGNNELRSPLTDPGVLATLALTVTAGCVVGGTLFAAEKEMGTADFLGLLPVRRRVIWLGKMLAGAGLVFVVVAAMLGGAAAAGTIGPPSSLPVWAAGLLASGLAAFAWGSVGSVVARSSLAAAALGAGLYGTATGIVLPVAGIVWAVFVRLLPAELRAPSEVGVVALALLALLAVPLALSLWLYAAPDRDRLRAAVRGKSGKPRPARRLPRLFPAFRAAVWMNVRQQRWMAVVLAAFGLLSGLSLLAPAAPFVAVWPSVGFFLAVLVGVIGWYDEQTNGAKRFWLERSLPTGRLWGAKVLVGLLATALMTLAALLPVVVKVIATRGNREVAPSFVMTTRDFPVAEFVLLWPVYGFAAGHLCGLLFKKTVVGVAVAAMGGAVAAAVWLPSLVGGGLHPWQVALPPLAMLAAARLLLWVGVADRLASRRGMIRLGLAGLVVLGATAGGLGYRVLEIPDDPAREADLAFEKREIPTFEADTARMKYRAAGVQLRAALGLSASDRRTMPSPALMQSEQTPLSRLPARQRDVLETAVEYGWQPTDDADAFLVAAFRNGWADTFAEASTLPPGTLEDPRELQLNSPLEHLTAVYAADTLLLVRGLKAQHDGDPQRFVSDFAQVLRLSRTVRYKSVSACADAGRRIEWRALQALPRWLDKLDGREDLLATVAAELEGHDRLAGDDRADVKLADQVVLRNTLNAASKVFRTEWDFARISDPDTRGKMDAEADVVNVCWQMPWEKERHRRLIGQGNGAGYPTTFDDYPPLRGLPGVGGWPQHLAYWRDTPRGGFSEVEKVTRVERNAARILVALRRYELTHGRPPASLTALAPEFLPTVPNDPYSGASFGYRLARAGETVTVETRTQRPGTAVLTELQQGTAGVVGGSVGAEAVPTGGGSPSNTQRSEPLSLPAGRPIIWGVGRDGIDDGGTSTADPFAGRHTDRVYWLTR